MTEGLRAQADALASMAQANFVQVEGMGDRLRAYADELANATDLAEGKGRTLGETFPGRSRSARRCCTNSFGACRTDFC